MPQGFVEMDRDEMMYVDGGINIPRGIVGAAVDVLLGTIMAYTGISVGFLGVKMLGKKATARFLASMGVGLLNTATKAVAAMGIGMSICTNVIVGQLGNFIFGNLWILTSPGNAVAGFFDWLDSRFGGNGLDGYISL